VNVRPDQVAGLTHVANALGLTASDVVRWFLDQGIAAIEQAMHQTEECDDDRTEP